MLPPNTVIGNRYKVIRLLGQGGMSNLYLCQDLRQQGQVWVLKEMIARYADPEEQKQALALFQREAHLLRTLNHRHIPKVVDNFQFQGKYYLAMEFVDGEDLSKKIEHTGGPLPEKQVVDWGIQIATVLYYLHCHKPPIIFRDVKPSNVMITANSIKLIDFGIARLLSPNKKGDTMKIGSPGYAPPEQYSGQSDPRSDIFALGVTLHHALTGRDPTVTQTPFIVPPARTLNPKLSTEIASIIDRATQLDPDKRYSSTIELKRELQALQKKLQAGTQVVAPGVQGATRPTPSSPAGSPTQPQLAPVAATAPTPTGTPTAAATGPQAPGPQPPSTPPAPAAPRRRFPVGTVLVVLFLATSLIAGGMFPSVVDDGREVLIKLWTQVVAQPPPSDPAEAGEQLYLDGGDLLAVLGHLGKAVGRAPEDGRLRILFQNALAEATGQPIVTVGVVLPQEGSGDPFRGLALAQHFLNTRGGIQGRLVVLDTADYAIGGSPKAIQAAVSGRAGRKQPESTRRPALLLLWAEEKERAQALQALTGVDLPVMLMSPGGEGLPGDVSPMPAAEIDLGQTVVDILPEEALEVLSLVPEITGATVSSAEPPNDPATAAELLAGHPNSTVVVRAPDASPLLQALGQATGHRLVVLASLSDRLPPSAPEGSLALVRYSPFAESAWAARFARGYDPMFGAKSPAPTLETGRAFDGLTHSLLSPRNPGSDFQGAGVVITEEGEASPADWYVYTYRGDDWVFDLGVKAK